MSADAASGDFPAGLLRVADAFQEQCGVLRAIVHAESLVCPDGGSPDIDRAMRVAAQLLALLHDQLAAVTGQHAAALRAAASGSASARGRAAQAPAWAQSGSGLAPGPGAAVLPGPGLANVTTIAAREPAPLPRFSQDWIGGDIRGLSAFAGELYDYVPKIHNVVTHLDAQVSGLDKRDEQVSALRTAWAGHATAARAAGSVADRIAQILDQLAVRLAQIEIALEDAAMQARSQGVPVNHAKGAPVEVQTRIRSATSARRRAWADDYEQTYQRSLLAADQARQEAADAITKITGGLAGSPEGIRLSDALTLTEGGTSRQFPAASASSGDAPRTVSPIVAALQSPPACNT